MNFFVFMRDLKRLFVPYKSPYKKVKICEGKGDGYVIADIPCDYCYSYGSNDDIAFEKGLYKRYKTHSFTYDHTIEKITDKPDYITFKREGVSHEKTEDCNTIESHFEENDIPEGKSLLLKMDVESAEWSVLATCNVLHKFQQIVIELHFYKIDGILLKILERLLLNFRIIHMHANHYLTNPYIDIEFPRVIEVTLLRNDLFDGNFQIDTDSTFPDPELDPVYPIPFPELRWWKRIVEPFSAVSLVEEKISE